MSETEIIRIEEQLIQDTDISELVYDVQDAATEIELLHGVGFKSILEDNDYQLFQNGSTYALLVEHIVIQGSAKYVYNELAGKENLCTLYPDLYYHMLEVVRTEGV